MTLNKSKILNHLEHFADKLREEKHHLACAEKEIFTKLPSLTREGVVAKIASNWPQFGDLYSDYQQIRDIQSLKKISYYIKLALTADFKQREGKLIIVRALQVSGEHFNADLLSKRIEIEDNTNVNFLVVFKIILK